MTNAPTEVERCGKIKDMHELFRRIARRTSEIMGSPWAFVVAFGVIVVWALFGPVFNYSNTWQLLINTGTTITTFLMVVLIQNTQNRDTKALHLKLDELIRTKKNARNRLVELEELSDVELDVLEAEFRQLRDRARRTKI